MNSATEARNPSRQSDFDLKGGTHTRLSDLISLRHIATSLSLKNQTSTRNPQAGTVSSRFRGRGIDFAEVRLYQPGDDIRSIDWRVTARTGKPHTKLFQEEREKPVLLVVDQSRPMYFGSKRAFKSVHAVEIATLLAWSMLDRGDRVGGVVYSDTAHQEIRPRRSRKTVLNLLKVMDALNNELMMDVLPNGPPPGRGGSAQRLAGEARQNNADSPSSNGLNNALKEIRRIARHGNSIYILSDFQAADEETQSHLIELSRHNDILGFCIYDPLEAQLPTPDIYEVTDGIRRHRIDSANHRIRQQFEERFSRHQQQLQEVFDRTRARLIPFATVDDPLLGLGMALGGK
ncbi:MAG: DUF58 domain-containing protein [Gammaproteobacteria bacterium]|nr:DUF58 domain-containing protein [Gammaproteobacteria bacterium]